MLRFFLIIGIILLLGCTKEKKAKKEKSLNDVSISYIKLALEVGRYSPDYIDAYYGPDSLKPKEAAIKEGQVFPADSLELIADLLVEDLNKINTKDSSDLIQLRQEYLHSQLSAVKTFIQIKGGKKLTFDEEAKALYEGNPPSYPTKYYDSLLSKLNSILPGKGEVSVRLENYKKGFIIPKEKLDTVFQTAIKEARKRTLKYVDLPSTENFKIEYVTDKPWSGYNWFKGNSYSLIQLNTDLPIFIDRAIDLACHEGYPGHHVYHLMLEKELVEKKGWLEYTVYPLFSPQGMISEGSANYGIDVAFPGKERIEFEKKHIFPLAGLDSAKAEEYYNIQAFTDQLSYAGNEAARNYLDGNWNKEQAIDWLHKYALMSKERATQRIGFIEKYRSYVINYNLGQDMVKEYIERNGGTDDQPEKRWKLFLEIISKPQTPAGLYKQ